MADKEVKDLDWAGDDDELAAELRREDAATTWTTRVYLGAIVIAVLIFIIHQFHHL